MTSRRGTLVEEGARELLQIHGYTARVTRPVSISGSLRPISSQPCPRARRGSSVSGNCLIGHPPLKLVQRCTAP